MIKNICLILVSALFLTGCGLSENKSADIGESVRNEENSEEPAVKEIFAMDTYMTMTAYGDSGQEAVDAAAEEIIRIENLVSTGLEDSEIAAINRDGAGNVSKDTEEMIRKSMELYKDTDGLFDITIYPVMKAWGFTTGDFRIPEKTELQTLLSSMGADRISIDTGGETVSVDDHTEIDLRAIAMSYTSAKVMDDFAEYGVTSGVVSLGGNVQTLGVKTDGSKWRVAVEDPNGEGDYIGVLSVEDKAVITSGGYERYFEENGKTYHHIIDPRTGYPAESGLTSVTIISDDGMLADGLSTSLFIMGKEKSVSFWKEHSDEFDMVLVDEDGNIYVSEGAEDSFECDKKIELIEKK